MLYMFTNRRRAKDTIMLLLDRYGADSMTVFVKEESVYIDVPKPIIDLDTIMHYAEKVTQDLSEVLNLDEITELYKGDGIQKFRM